MRKALNRRINEAYNDMVDDMMAIECEDGECEAKQVNLDTLEAEDSLYKALGALRDDAKRQGREPSTDDVKNTICDALENFLCSYDDVSYWEVADDELSYMLVVGSSDEEIVDHITNKLNSLIAD